jgi:hypothetical protein
MCASLVVLYTECHCLTSHTRSVMATNATLCFSCRSLSCSPISGANSSFRVYLDIACAFVVVWGYHPMLDALGFRDKVRRSEYAYVQVSDREQWPFYTPRALVLLLWIMSAAMGFCLAIMWLWQILLISRGETTVESSDNG